MRSICLFVIGLMLFSCNSYDRPDLTTLELKTLEGEEYIYKQNDSLTANIFIFMSPECPLCINYTRSVLQLEKKFDGAAVQFIMVFPGTYYTTTQIAEFRKEYNLDMLFLLDPKCQLSKLLSATVTPEAVVLNQKGEMVYSGAIDDWAFAPGKKRQVVTKKYLENAILEVLQGQYPSLNKTEPVGCYIEL